LTRCAQDGIALIALGGEAEPDAELTALSLAPAGSVAQAGEYLRHGDVGNFEQLLRFLADTFLMCGYGFEPPREIPDLGVRDGWRVDATRPTVGVCYYRSHELTGNTQFVDELCAALERAGANALPVWSYSLRPAANGRVAALELLDGRIDALVVTMLASGGQGAGDRWDADALAALDVPVIQAVCSTQSRAEWERSEVGLSPLDAATQVAIPEFDGRIIGGVVSFKERDSAGVARYRADPERCRRLAQLAVRHARLRRRAAGKARRVALLLTSFPTRHARVGMAVGLDTPASALELLARLGASHPYQSGDQLMHALIAAGGHDPEFLTDEQLQRAPLRLPVARYLDWYQTLPASLRERIEARWGPPPGELYLSGSEFVFAGLDLGQVLVAIQPPRGWGEDPVALYHDPELPPTHHYLACYRFIEEVWGAEAIVHLGKHGTLEWLPGKLLALSPACAPDAALGAMPLIYPFVVNDPGEGVQAKRRAHAVIVDHLTPPMMRAGGYGELAELEALLDDYARLEVLDPGKLPALAARIWEAIERANLQADLGVHERPADLGALVERIDGYLCEVKDIQVKDGLHVLGRAPEGEQLIGTVAAILRLPGLRRAIAAVFDLDERALLEAPGGPAPSCPEGLLERFPGPAASASDLLERLEDAQRALLDSLAEADWDPARAASCVQQVLGCRDPEVVRLAELAAGEVVPRLRAAPAELDSVIAALDGRHVPAGPSGSPTRGRLDVLPTGRNFYGSDPRAIPSELAWEVGQRLADQLLERHRRESGALPKMVGLVVWGTSAMRTDGDDIAEVLALLGVRPRWAAESRRVCGTEVIPLDELGRPRIDVTVRISGFFRDAFPHAVALLDRAIAQVAALDEPPELNLVAAHARADAERLAGSLASADAWRMATTRIFGSRPGTYGAGLMQLLESGDWRGDADLAAVYEAWGGFAYGEGLDGRPAAQAMRACFARIEVAAKNVDNCEHDILDSDDYYQYHGGMVATVRALSGRTPAAYIGDSSDPSRVRARSLAQEARRVFRARIANPRWIASMIRHGYRGAAELQATVDYLFGYDATTGVVDDWMYAQLAQRYLLDADVARFMDSSNPWAARAIAERLLEAAQRGMWQSPDEELLARVQARMLALEGELEEAAR